VVDLWPRVYDQRVAPAVRQPSDPEAILPGEDERDESENDLRISRLLHDRRRLAGALLVIALAIVAIYFVIPQLVGLDESLHRLDEATWYWIVVAIAFNIAAFGSYVALFRGVLGGRGEDAVRERLDARASYQITMAALAATRLFSAAGAGGLVLTYWALRKAGMQRRRSACRMVAFLVLTYSVYLAALVVFGVLLRTGVLSGPAPIGGTVVPAAVAGVLIVLLGLVSLVPGDFERRLHNVGGEGRVKRLSERLATGPATFATGVRTALAYIRNPRRGALAMGGAVGFWAAQIGILWASFEAFGGDVPFGVLVQGFFVGMAANLIPSPAGGVGSVDAGMIGAFLLFGVAAGLVFPAVLLYRVIAFWLPIPPGIVAYFQLRRTVARWDAERRGYTSESKVTVEAT
jgi:uncharacterized protein (TIRG00374 family)